MAYGRFKLLQHIGHAMGWQPLLLIVILSQLSGAVVGIICLSCFALDPVNISQSSFAVLTWQAQAL